MQKIYTDQTLLAITHVKNLLESAHIQSELRNEFAAGGVGELSFLDSWPELWVNYEDVAQAKKIISDYKESMNKASTNNQDWICRCGESNGSAFASCWACGLDKPL